jgi:hypothetical protein
MQKFDENVFVLLYVKKQFRIISFPPKKSGVSVMINIVQKLEVWQCNMNEED